MIKRLTKIGKGKLPDFQKAYHDLGDEPGVTVRASQLFPMIAIAKEEEDYVQIYEYIIYYEEIVVPKKEEPRLIM